MDGFLSSLQLGFGHLVTDFHTWTSSFSKLLRYPLGDFSYYQLDAARPDIAAVFFALYMALVFLVCMNIAIAILTIALEDVTFALKVSELLCVCCRHTLGCMMNCSISIFSFISLHVLLCIFLY